jgi:catechol 2,3-dioxygenase-like lactoylglutathione lyase family enzyme
MINRMNCTGVWINDGEKAYDFYANKLGFKVTQDKQFGGGGRFLMVVPPDGGAQLTIATPAPGMASAQVGVQTPIVWETDDIDATYADLRAKGVEFPQPPTQQFWGGFEATFKDPDGNLFKLLQMRA